MGDYLKGEGQILGATQAKAASLPQAIAQLEPQIERAARICAHLENIADRLTGSRPQPAGADENRPDTPPHSLVDSLRRKRNDLDNWLTRCEQQLSRISEGLEG